MIVESEDYTFDLGANISITCNTSVPSTIVWIYSPLGNRLPSNAVSNQIDEKSAVLLITQFKGSNQGTYQCNANTGTMSDSKQIQINERGMFVSQPLFLCLSLSADLSI